MCGAFVARSVPCWATGGMTTQPTRVNTPRTPRKTMATAQPRRTLCRVRPSTSGLSASVRKKEMTSRVMTVLSWPMACTTAYAVSTPSAPTKPT